MAQINFIKFRERKALNYIFLVFIHHSTDIFCVEEKKQCTKTSFEDIIVSVQTDK